MSDSMDLAQFLDVFYEEAAEHLGAMESLLLAVDIEHPDDEDLNAIFRAAHSIKGGAATFGLGEITSLTHEMETVFDRVRKHEMALSPALVNEFLASGDMLGAMLAARRGAGDPVPAQDVEAHCERLRGFLEPVVARAQQRYELHFGPLDDKFSAADVDNVVGDLAGFGTVSPLASDDPSRRVYLLESEVGAEDLNDALGFMVDPARVKVVPAGAAPALYAEAPAQPASASQPASQPAAAEAGAQGEDFGLFEADSATPAPAPSAAPAAAATAASEPPKASRESAGKVASPAKAAGNDSSSIRVAVEKIDQLINLVGELVITQAMLAQAASTQEGGTNEALANGLAQLERSTRDLQESAMAIRMLPMSFAFSRFPRVMRDVAARLGKEVELVTIGENTELDKGLIERIVDPLTHLVRNSLDHGLELPDERVAAGKPRKGTVQLSAFHQGGNIVIEVADDGRGLRREKILSKARERGMHAPDSLSDADVWNLIFEPGFSTADVITDVSGRGVGMDVVRRNIKEMGGRVEITSNAGVGTRMTIRLPLTLAILDGMSVRVDESLYILPLAYITESLQPAPGAIRTVGGSERVLEVRGDYLPVVSLREVLGTRTPRAPDAGSILVIIEAEGGRVALEVDDLVGQHQVVIKSLEANFRRVPGISGATIMGDGRVALIVDAGHIVGLSRHRIAKAA